MADLINSGIRGKRVQTLESNLSTIAVDPGQIIFCTDTGNMYFDSLDSVRVQITNDELKDAIEANAASIDEINTAITNLQTAVDNTMNRDDDVVDAGSASTLSNVSTSIPTERKVYYGLPKINDNHSYNYSNTYYAPTGAGTSGQVLISNGSGAPSWGTLEIDNTTYADMTGATNTTAGTSGLVPAPAAGDNEKYLSGAGTWDEISIDTLGAASADHTHNYAGSSSAGGAANSVANALTLTYYTGSDGSTPNVYTYDGSSAVNINMSDSFAQYAKTSENAEVADYAVQANSVSNSLTIAINGGSESYNGESELYIDVDTAISVATSNSITGLAVSGKTITYTKGDGTTGTITTQDTNTTYSTMTGATSSAAGASGLVPAPAAGDNDAYLSGAGTWDEITIDTLGAAAASHTHNYAGSSSAGGNATTANKVANSLSITSGGSTKTYNGSSAVSVDVDTAISVAISEVTSVANADHATTAGSASSATTATTANKVANSLTVNVTTGSATTTTTYDGSAAKTVDINMDTAGSADVAAKVAYALNITADGTTATYDGSATKTVDIDSAISNATDEYIKGLSISGKVITYTKGDGTTGTLTTQDTNTTYSTMTGATSSAAGASGLVPAPAAGDNDAYLSGAGTWDEITIDTLGAASADHTHNYAGSSSAGGNATTANKVANSLSITSGGSTKTYNGSSAVSVDVDTAISVAISEVTSVANADHATTATTATTANKLANSLSIIYNAVDDAETGETYTSSYEFSGASAYTVDLTDIVTAMVPYFLTVKYCSGTSGSTTNTKTFNGSIPTTVDLTSSTFYAPYAGRVTNALTITASSTTYTFNGSAAKSVNLDNIYLPLTGGTLTGNLYSQRIIPTETYEYILGSTDYYWKNVISAFYVATSGDTGEETGYDMYRYSSSDTNMPYRHAKMYLGSSSSSVNLSFGCYTDVTTDNLYSSSSQTFYGFAYFTYDTSGGSTGAFVPYVTAARNLGSTTKTWYNTYTGAVITTNNRGYYITDSSGTNVRIAYMNASNIVGLGNSGYTTYVNGSAMQLRSPDIKIGYGYNKATSDDYNTVIYQDMDPYTSDLIDLGGSSYYYNRIYVSTIYRSSEGSLSDRREKQNIVDLDTDKSISLIMGLNPVEYEYIKYPSIPHYGFIAQDVRDVEYDINNELVIASATVNGDDDAVYDPSTHSEDDITWHLSYDNFIAPLIKMVQNMKNTIDSMSTKIEELESTIANLTSSNE